MKERMNALYSLLCEKGDKWSYQQDLYAELKDHYPELDGRAFHDSTARLQMSKDITEINRSPEYDKIIVSTRRGVKLATKEEARTMIGARKDAVCRELQSIAILQRKFDKDGQRTADGGVKSVYVGG